MSGCYLLSGETYQQKKAREFSVPERFFEGQSLRMGNAIYKNDATEIERLITEEGYEIDSRGEKDTYTSYTYLNYAVLVGRVNAARTLLKLGADVNAYAIKTTEVKANINIAAGVGNASLIKLLVSYGVDLNPELDRSPLEELLFHPNKQMFDYLIDHGADVNHGGYFQSDLPVVTAQRLKEINYVYYFLEKGADPLMYNFAGVNLAYSVEKSFERENRSGKGRDRFRKLREKLEEENQIEFPYKKRFKEEAKKDKEEHYERLSKEEKELVDRLASINDERKSGINE